MAISPNPDTTWLLAQVYRFESIATSSQTFNEEDVVEFLNTELQSVLMPIIQSVNEEFGVMYIDYPLADLTENFLRIPSQATGNRLKNVQYVSPQGYMTNIPRISPDKLGAFTNSYQAGFYLRNADIVFYPTAPTGSGSLRLSYFRRPNTLTETINTGRVISVDWIGNTVTLDASPAGTDWVVGGLVDIIVGSSPFDFREREAEILNINGAVLELEPDIIAKLDFGDYFALAGFSPVAQFVPAEAMHLLAQLGAARCLQSLGDTEGYAVADKKVEQMKEHLINLISDRVEAQPKKLSARGMTRRNSTGWYGGN